MRLPIAAIRGVIAAGLTVLLAVLVGCGSAPATDPVTTGGSSTPASTASGPTVTETNPAGDIPDNQVYLPFTSADGGFTVSVPQGWARTAEGNAVVFSDKLNSIRIESAARPQPADMAAATATEVPQLAALPGYTPGSVSMVQRKPGSALLITYGATSRPNPVTGKSVPDDVERYAFWHGGTQVLLILASPKGADNVDPWRTVTDSLRWLR